MPVAITAELIGAQDPQLVQVVVTGLTGATDVNVWAEPPNSPRRIIRGGLGVDPTSDALVLVDPIPELGRPLVYVVEWTASGTRSQLSAAPVTVPDPGRHVLTDPYTGQSVLVDVLLTPDERVNELSGSTLYPVGSPVGVAITDLRRADSGQLEVLVTAGSVAEFLEVTGSGRVLASRHPADGCDVAALEVINVRAVTRSRRTRAGDRVAVMPFDVVAQPDPSTPYQASTLGDVAAWYGTSGTLADLHADHASLLDVARAEWV